MLPMTGASARGLRTPPATWAFSVGQGRSRHLFSGLEKTGLGDYNGRFKTESLVLVSILTEASVLCISGWATVPELSWDLFYFVASLAPSLDAGSISLPLIVINKAISRQGEMSLRTSQP